MENWEEVQEGKGREAEGSGGKRKEEDGGGGGEEKGG